MALTKNSKEVLVAFQPESKKVRYKVTFDSAYLAGGEELDCTDEFSQIGEVRVETAIVGGPAYIVRPNPATRVAKYKSGKVDLQVFGATNAVSPFPEVVNGTNLSGLVVEVIVEGPAA